MSCNCRNSKRGSHKRNCHPQQDPLSSTDLSSLFSELFGDGTGIVYEDGKWTFESILGIPKNPGEGILDYLLRVSQGAMYPKGVWDAGTFYCKNSVVSYDGGWWIALDANTGNTPQTPSAHWAELLSSLEGLTGLPGQDGLGVTISL